MASNPLQQIERIEVAAIQPGDLVILHVRDLTATKVDYLKDAWKRATELPNRVVIVSDGIEVEVKRPEEVNATK
jgi:hypothetical protein